MYPVNYANNIGSITVASLQNVWFIFLQYIPQIIGAIIVVIVGWIVASFLGGVVKRIIKFTGVDEIVNRSRLNERMKIATRYSLLSGMIGEIVKWLVIIATLMAAADILNLPQITEFLRQIIMYIPRAIVAVIILTVGMLAAEFVASFLQGALTASRMPIGHKQTLSSVARYAIVIFSFMAALTQLGVVPQLIQIAFGGLVLALALAFGLGGRDEAARWLEQFRREK